MTCIPRNYMIDHQLYFICIKHIFWWKRGWLPIFELLVSLNHVPTRQNERLVYSKVRKQTTKGQLEKETLHVPVQGWPKQIEKWSNFLTYFHRIFNGPDGWTYCTTTIGSNGFVFLNFWHRLTHMSIKMVHVNGWNSVWPAYGMEILLINNVIERVHRFKSLG